MQRWSAPAQLTLSGAPGCEFQQRCTHAACPVSLNEARELLQHDWNANFAKKLRKLRKLKINEDQFNTCLSCAGELYQNSGNFENVTVRSELRFSAGMAKRKNILLNLRNLRNLRNFFVKICVTKSIN